MRRWRCIGRTEVETTDHRTIVEPDVSGEVPAVYEPWGAFDWPVRVLVPVRLEGDRIEAYLPWRLRDLTPAFMGGETELDYGVHGRPSIVLWRPRLASLGPGPSAWAPEDLA